MNQSLDQKIRHRNAVARAHSQAISGQTTRLMVKEAPVYSGRSLEILPIVLVNLILTFLTVGIYRFWAKTRIRRYFISRASFLGDPLEYGGTGLELFIGFLIVLAVLVPVSIVSGILQSFLVRPGTDPMSALIFQAIYLLAFYFLYNVAVYRAQRYRLSRISWRGICGGQEGSALLYATYAVALGLLTFVTFGLSYPIMRRVLVGYRINRSCFGSERLSFTSGLIKFFVAWLVPWLLALTGILALVFALWKLGLTNTSADELPPKLEQSLPVVWDNYKYLLISALALSFIAFIWYRTFEVRHWIRGTRFDQLAFTSRLNALHIVIPYVTYLTLLVLAIGGVVFAIGTFVLGGSHSAAGIPTDSLVSMGVAAFVALWLVGGILHPIILQHWLLNNICRTLTVQGSFSPDTLFQNQQEIPRSGEGLADALDVDAF